MHHEIAQQLLDQVKNDYDTIALHFSHTRMNQWYEVSYLIEQYIRPGQSVLDLGCGNGRVADAVNEIKATYTGMDVSPALIARAQQLRPQNTFAVGSMLHTGYDDASFDHVLLIASLHHVPSHELRKAALAEAARVLRPGGTILMTNWNLHQWSFLWRRWRTNIQKILRQHNRDWNDLLIPWYDQQGHLLAQRYYHCFTTRELRRLAAVTNLDLIDQYYESHGMHLSRWSGRNVVTVLQKPLGE